VTDEPLKKGLIRKDEEFIAKGDKPLKKNLRRP